MASYHSRRQKHIHRVYSMTIAMEQIQSAISYLSHSTPIHYLKLLPQFLMGQLSCQAQITLDGDGKVTFKKELSYNYSYFLRGNLGTLVTSVTVTTIKSWLKK